MNSNQAFLSPRLVGPRFEEHSIPLEMLRDLAVLEEMVIEVAKWCYKQEHPDRKRLPKGFSDGMSLQLTGVEEGSAIANMRLCFAATATSLLPAPEERYEEERYFYQAKDAIVAAIAAAEHNKPVHELPVVYLSYFDRIGRSLRDNEAIEFVTQSPNTPARLDKTTRQRLVQASKVKEITNEICIFGTIPEANQDEWTFLLQIKDNRKLEAPLYPQHFDAVLQAFNGYASGVQVQLKGIGRFSRANKIVGIESVEHLTVLEGFLSDDFQPDDSLPITHRLHELLSLQDGWLDGEGKAPDRKALSTLNDLFTDFYEPTLPPPYLYPTPEGGIQAEWLIHGHDISLEIDLDTFMGHWHCLNLTTDAENEHQLNLSFEEAWGWVVQELKKLAALSV